MRVRRLLTFLVVLAALFPVALGAYGRSTLTLDNQSGEDALVRLAGGPTSGDVDVPAGASRTVSIKGGTYRLLVRYGKPGGYRFTRGDAFTVSEDSGSWEEVTITLHTVRNGNYGSRPSTEVEFNGRP
jgi:hypothetical protein